MYTQFNHLSQFINLCASVWIENNSHTPNFNDAVEFLDSEYLRISQIKGWGKVAKAYKTAEDYDAVTMFQERVAESLAEYNNHNW